MGLNNTAVPNLFLLVHPLGSVIELFPRLGTVGLGAADPLQNRILQASLNVSWILFLLVLISFINI